MTVRVTREAEPQIELYGAYSGELLGGTQGTRSSLTFTPTDDYLIVVPKNQVNYAQLEEAPTPSSYILTTTSSATRAGETLTIPSANLPYSATAMSIAMEGTMDGANLTFVSWQEGADNLISITSGASDFSFTQEAATVVDTVSGGSYTSGVNVPFSIASRHGSTFINGAVGGTALTENTTPVALPDLSTTDLDLGSDFMGTIKTFRMWADDIGDVGIEEASS